LGQAFSNTTAKIRGRAIGAAFREAKRGEACGGAGAKPPRSYLFYLIVTGCIFHISSAYCFIVRSLVNLPALAVFRTAIFAQWGLFL
jgi:hypothetical protein